MSNRRVVSYKPVDDSPFEYLKHFSQSVFRGTPPSEQTMLFIANAIHRYIAEKGRISLDEAFSMKSKRSEGNPAAQDAKRNLLNSKLFDMACLRVAENMSIQDAAQRVSRCDNSGIKPSQLDSAYRRKHEGESIGYFYEKRVSAGRRKGEIKL